jgi:autotransporter family porin
VNFVPGLTVADGAVVPIAGDGTVCVLASAATHVVVDLTGTMRGDGFSSVGPTRLLDTRTGTGVSAGKRGSSAYLALDVAGQSGVPDGQGDVVLTLTVTEPTDTGYLAAFPCDRSWTGTSTVNFAPGQTVANLAVVPTGNDGKACVLVYTQHGGTVHVVADASGWVPGPQLPANTTSPSTTPPVSNATSSSGFAPVGAALPGDAECAARVHPAPENKRMNVGPNHTRGASHAIAGQPILLARADGNFVGTTDEIIQWAACKWGYDADVLRAQTVVEAWWRQTLAGPTTTDASQCAPDFRGSLPCPQWYGLLQLPWFWYQEGWPALYNSTAYNLDLGLAQWRACFEGQITYLNDPRYGPGDAWGCIGRHASGAWHNAASEEYVQKIRDKLAERTWEQPWFQEP